MLDSIRSRKTLIKVVLWTVVIVFIAFYAGNFASVNRRDPSSQMASVGDEKIGIAEFQHTYESIRRQQEEMYKQQGGELSPQVIAFFRQQAIQSLVDRKLLLREAKKAGITTSDEEVQSEILQYDFLKRNGQFVTMAEYERIIDSAFRMSVDTFEKTIRDDIIIAKYNDLLTAGMLVSDKEVEDQYRKQKLTAKIDYVKFDIAPAMKDLQPTPEEVRGYYESHKNDFQTGEQRKVQYLWVSHSSEKNKVQIPESKLKEYYDQNKERFGKPEQVHARHILLKTGEGKDDAAVLKQAQELVAKLRAGANFEELAKQNSEDPGSKENGGDLGSFGRGQMVPEFEKAAFELQPNQISDPVKTQFGYHIIQSLGKQPAFQPEFALVKDQIYRELSEPQAMKSAEDQAKKLHEEITKNKKSMAEIAKIQLVELKTSDFFSKDQDIPGLSPAFRNAAFELNKGEISEPVRVFQDFAVIQLLDTRSSEIQPFEKVQTKATEKYKHEKATEIATEQAKKFYDSIGAATDLKAAADKAKLAVKSTDEFTKNGYMGELSQAKDINDKAFSMKVGEISEPMKSEKAVIVFQLKDKKEFNPTDFAKEKDTIREQLLSSKQSTFIQGYRAMLRKKYEKEIWINEAAVNPQET
jgi:peptidyl-prolyl cis-trans isomerase D